MKDEVQGVEEFDGDEYSPSIVSRIVKVFLILMILAGIGAIGTLGFAWLQEFNDQARVNNQTAVATVAPEPEPPARAQPVTIPKPDPPKRIVKKKDPALRPGQSFVGEGRKPVYYTPPKPRIQQIDSVSSRAENYVEPIAPKASKVTVLQRSAKVVESDEYYSTYSWQALIQNAYDGPASFDMTIRFYDADGYELDWDYEVGKKIAANTRQLFTGTKMFKREVARRVADFSVEVAVDGW